ncbi:MAG: hypothetical protein U0175_23780 [Caldilineaceae bacterium]
MLIKVGWRLLGALLGLLVGLGMAYFWVDPILWLFGINSNRLEAILPALATIGILAAIGTILGAIMIYLPMRANLIIATPLLIAITATLYINRYQFIERPPSVEPIGNFELLTYDLNNGTFYGLRYQGTPIQIEEQAGFSGDEQRSYSRFETIITLGQAPVFVVHVGDQYQMFFYLVHEVDGQLQVQRLSASIVSKAQWLDGAQATATQEDHFVYGRKEFSGGRWLLLGDNCVLDVQKLTAYPIDTQPIFGDYKNRLLRSGLLVSPDQHSFVSLAESDTNEYLPSGLARTVAKLIVLDFVEGNAYILPITRPQMRYSYPERIDAQWIEHHFVWQKNDKGVEQLVKRANFTPLPYHGDLIVDIVMRNMSYNLAPVKPELFDALAQFLEENYQVVKKEESESDDYGKSLRLSLGEQQLYLRFTTYNIPSGELVLQVFGDTENQLLKAIGQRFDEVLATGKYDDLFLGDPGT